MHQRNCDGQAGGRIAATVIPFVKTSHCIQLEVIQNQDHSLVEKFVFTRELGLLQTGGDSGTMFTTWLVCLKFSHWKHCLKVLHVDHSLLQVYFKWATVRFAGLCIDLLLNTMLPCWHDVREETFWTLILLNNINSSVARSKMTDVVTGVGRVAETEE
jgi:hypothetical protein